MRYDHYFWDFDGTLFDSYPCIAGAFQSGAKEQGLDICMDTLMPLAKVSVKHMCDSIAAQYNTSGDTLREGYRAHRADYSFEAMPPYAGIPALLAAIVQAGGKNYLYTHSGKTATDALAFYGLTDYFADAVTADDGFPLKPAPDALLHLMRKHLLDPARCVMVGDRDIDVQAGLNAGMAGALIDLDHYYDHFAIENRYDTVESMAKDFLQE